MATLTLTVAASADDAYLDGNGGTYVDNTGQIAVGASGGTTGNYGQGWRFTNVTLTSGDTVTSAVMKLMKNGANWGSIDYRWTAIDEDNTATFSSGSPPGARSIVSASIAAENLNISLTDGTVYDRPSTGGLQATLGAAIESVTGRGGWASGNALAVVCNSKQDASAVTTFAREAYHDYDSATASSEPQLVITYTPGGTVSASQVSATVSVTPLPVPTYVGAGTAAFTATNAATLAPGLPSGWQADDIHILLAARSDNTAMTDLSGSGWTQIAALSGNNTAAQRVEVWWRRAVGGDTAPTITFGSSTIVRGARIFGIRGCPTTGDPFDTPSRSSNAASATVSTTNVTPSVPTLGLFLYAYEDDPTAASTVTGWGAFSVSTSSLGNDMALGAATHTFIFGQSYGTPSTTVSGGTFANSVNVGILLPMIAPASATVSPAQLSLTSSLHTASAAGETGGGAATFNAALLSAAASLPSATVTAVQTATATPSLLAATTSLPTATVTGLATVTPSLLSLSASLGAATVSAVQAATITPALLTAAASLPTPAVSTSGAATVSPGLLTATASLGAATVSGAASAAPSLLTAAASLPAPTVSGVATVTPALLSLVASLPTATASAGGTATVQPSLLTATLSLHAATVTAVQTITVTPSLLTATASLGSATVSAGGNITLSPAMLTASVSLHTPTVSAGGSVTLTPALLSLAASLPAASVSVSDTAAPALLAVALTLHQPSLSAVRHVTATPDALALSLVLPTAVAGFIPTQVPGRVRAGARRSGDGVVGARVAAGIGAGTRQVGSVGAGASAA